MSTEQSKGSQDANNIVECNIESNMLHSFGHHVARCCPMLHDVERNMISIKHRLQHCPIFLWFSVVNNNVAFGGIDVMEYVKPGE